MFTFYTRKHTGTYICVKSHYIFRVKNVVFLAHHYIYVGLLEHVTWRACVCPLYVQCVCVCNIHIRYILL